MLTLLTWVEKGKEGHVQGLEHAAWTGAIVPHGQRCSDDELFLCFFCNCTLGYWAGSAKVYHIAKDQRDADNIASV